MTQAARTVLSPIPETLSIERFNDDVDRKIDAYIEAAKEKELQREKVKSRSRSFLACELCGKENCEIVCTGSLAKTEHLMTLLRKKFDVVTARMQEMSQQVDCQREESSSLKLDLENEDEDMVKVVNIPADAFKLTITVNDEEDE
jgi:hypothetical protein